MRQKYLLDHGKNGSERSGGNLAWTRRFLMSERLGSWLTEQIKKLRSDESKEVDERVFIKFGSQYSPIRLLGRSVQEWGSRTNSVSSFLRKY